MVYAGVPEDMLSKTLPYSKELVTNAQADIRAKITAFIESITPDDETKQFLWNWWSYVLSGHRTEHQFLILVGTGANGKGLFDILLKAALKDYMQTPDVSLITQTKRGDLESASPVVATCMGALLVTMHEAGPGETINVVTLKKLAAGDPVMCRFLKRNPVSARWSAALLMATNKIPQYERDTQNGMSRRANVLELPYSFVTEPDLRKKEQKPKNISLDDDFKKSEYGAQFLMMGLENLQRLEVVRNYDRKVKPYLPPNSVKKHTKAFVDDNDPIRLFVKECIIKTPRSEGGVIMLKQMQERFRSWVRETLCDSRCLK